MKDTKFWLYSMLLMQIYAKSNCNTISTSKGYHLIWYSIIKINNVKGVRSFQVKILFILWKVNLVFFPFSLSLSLLKPLVNLHFGRYTIELLFTKLWMNTTRNNNKKWSQITGSGGFATVKFCGSFFHSPFGMYNC